MKKPVFNFRVVLNQNDKHNFPDPKKALEFARSYHADVKIIINDKYYGILSEASDSPMGIYYGHILDFMEKTKTPETVTLNDVEHFHNSFKFLVNDWIKETEAKKKKKEKEEFEEAAEEMES